MAKTKLTNLERRLALLIAMPTETRRREACKNAIESLSAELRELGLFVTTYSGMHPSLVATTKNTKKPKIMLVAHLDVVPANDQAQFEPQFKDNKIIGRGAYDMKFAAACYLEFLHFHLNDLHKFDIGIMFTTDEEIGGEQGTGMLVNEGWRAEVALIPDSVTPWKLEEKAKGKVTLTLSFEGRSTHSSRPQDGVNAVQNAIDAIFLINNRYNSGDPDDTTAVVTELNGGDSDNQVPDNAKAIIDIRSFDKAGMDEIIATIKKLVKSYNGSCDVITYKIPLILDKSSEFISILQESYEKIIGEKISFNSAYGASDGDYFYAKGIPSLIIAPRGGDQHGPEEFISREDLALFYNMMVDFIYRVHGFEREKVKKISRSKKTVSRILDNITS